MSEREVPLMKEFLAEFRHTRARLFRRQIIDKTVQDIHSGRMLQMKAGIKGQCDVYGFISSTRPVLGPNGNLVGRTLRQGWAIPFEVEFKGAKTKTSDEQVNWKAFCNEWGVPHIILRAMVEEHASITILRWKDELNKFILEIAKG